MVWLSVGIRAAARLAQSVEHETLNLRVVGSSPTLGAFLFFRGLDNMSIIDLTVGVEAFQNLYCSLCCARSTMSGWPSGLRRCVQVAVYICRRGFESHFWHTFSCFRLNGGVCYGSSQRFVLISLIQYWITWHFISWTANLEHYSPYFVLLNVFKVINIIGISKNYAAPNKGLEPLTLRLKVWCSTDWANRAAVSRVQHNNLFLICKHIPYM